jgi:hypothetical protein
MLLIIMQVRFWRRYLDYPFQHCAAELLPHRISPVLTTASREGKSVWLPDRVCKQGVQLLVGEGCEDGIDGFCVGKDALQLRGDGTLIQVLTKRGVLCRHLHVA